MLNRNKNNKFYKSNRTLFKAFALFFLFFFSFFSPSSQASPKIAICQIVEHPALNVNRQGILDALKEQGYSTPPPSSREKRREALQEAQRLQEQE